MPDARTPLNVSIRERTAEMLREDSLAFNKSLDGIADKLFSWFLTTKSAEERRTFLSTVPNKGRGRRPSR